MRKFPIQLTKAEMRFIKKLLDEYLNLRYTNNLLDEDENKLARRILFVLKEKEL